jgi:uncharacterized protein YecE (DUF72 family)
MTKKLAELARKKLEREEKILKRRELSEKRALAMHKARIQSTDSLHSATKLNKYYVGCSGWFYWKWWGKFYPQKMQPQTWFSHYQHSFDTVELNAPFYTWPTVATVKSWQRQLQDKDFIYTIKVPELITHVKKFKNTKTLIKDFQYLDSLLYPNMGCFLFQFPPSFKYTLARLKNIVTQLNPDFKNVEEFRHASWWNDKVFSAFKADKIIFCSCSSPKLPETLIKTADDIYVRFHGKTKMYRHDYSSEELEIWAKKIKKSKARTAWIYFNNDYECHAVKNAKELMQLLK